MKRTRLAQAALGAIGLVAVAATSAGAASSGEVPTFQEYQHQAFTDVDGQYIVNGDEALPNNGQLRQYYDRMTSTKTDKGTTPVDGLIVNTVSGKDDKWSASQALNLTYCVSTKFGTSYSTVVNAMAQGAALWEGASSKVNFVYVPAQDSACNTRNTSGPPK